MPLVAASPYRPPALLGWSGHALTVYPFLFRRVPALPYARERIATPDGDFLDVDWIRRGRARAAVVLHGMEGNSGKRYVRGMVRAFVDEGWDAAAMNMRGCSGEPNRTIRLYHAGATEDLDVVVRRVVREYDEVVLIGFSIGGGQILKYLGERAADARIRAAVAFSVPCDLASSATRLDLPSNRLYRTDLGSTMRRKLRAKARRFPELREVLRAGTGARRFDEVYTAPYHGFGNAEEYWRACSGQAFLSAITVPTLLVSALDDPFLGPSSYPVEAARAHPCLWLETPRQGGHIGFVRFDRQGRYWSEERALEFVRASGVQDRFRFPCDNAPSTIQVGGSANVRLQRDPGPYEDLLRGSAQLS